ncbi:MAG: SDR family oxidoreductase [Alphaproteobacteria bacterium]|nr:MAG: SDR family oxidoreductase [Alphaproteobacteria bacterium]
MGKLAGKVAVITGAGRKHGLGEAIAKRLSEDGAAVVISDIGNVQDDQALAGMVGVTEEMQSIADEITAAGGKVSAYSCDVRSYDQVEALAQHAVDHFGRLDIWVNNAGIGFIMKPLLELSTDDWAKVIDVNLTGAFYGLKVAAHKMVEQGEGGRIINIASQAAKSGFPFAQAYCSSKHGLVGLVRSAAIELGRHGITVNNVCPNHVTTKLGRWQNEYFARKLGLSLDEYMARMRERIPMGRPGLPSDTANAVAFLCSDEAAYITAESMNVSGGEEPH